MAKIIDGAIQVQVNAQIHVDDQTFNTCMNLIKIYAKERNMNAMVVKFDDDMYLGYEVNGIFEDSEKLTYCPLCNREAKKVGD